MQKYNLQVDIWSLGVVFYVCLCGYPPFADEVPWHNLPIEEQITEGKWRFDPGEPWDSISQGAKDLVSGCLKVVPTERIGIKAAVAMHEVGEAAFKRQLYQSLIAQTLYLKTMIEAWRSTNVMLSIWWMYNGFDINLPHLSQLASKKRRRRSAVSRGLHHAARCCSAEWRTFVFVVSELGP